MVDDGVVPQTNVERSTSREVTCSRACHGISHPSHPWERARAALRKVSGDGRRHGNALGDSRDELAARQTRGAIRDQLTAMAGLEVVSFDVYEVPGHEYPAG